MAVWITRSSATIHKILHNRDYEPTLRLVYRHDMLHIVGDPLNLKLSTTFPQTYAQGFPQCI